jgi:hypothetical protein
MSWGAVPGSGRRRYLIGSSYIRRVPRSALYVMLSVFVGLSLGTAAIVRGAPSSVLETGSGGQTASSSPNPLTTAVWDPGGEPAEHLVALRRVRAAGARVIYVQLRWREIAPAERPPGFDATDPTDPGYRWTSFDATLQRVVRMGLEPLVSVYGAPQWAEGDGQRPPGAVPGSLRPDPVELGRFATAAAKRYSGNFQGLPRVRYWQLWAEQNLYFHLNPQLERETAVAPVWYRRMLNAFAARIHAVHRDNVVITGGLAPFTSHRGHQRFWGLGPLHFMRVMLCMGKDLKPTCSARSQFDVWAHHPYTSGGPTHKAYLPDDVSLGDLPEMQRLLQAAIKHNRVSSRQRVRFWVTEFSWDTSPPDPKGVPARLHARWVAEALYRMWRSGITLVTWLQLRDTPMSVYYAQSGLYFQGRTIAEDKPKPALKAFRFPFVALPEGRRVIAWGRTPTSRSGVVVVESRGRQGWRRVARLRASRHGIFSAALSPSVRSRLVRARLPNGEASLPFRVVPTRDRPMFAFGTIPK